MCLTRKPISSVWAATITRPSPLPFFVPITLPKGVGVDLVRQRTKLLTCDLTLALLPPGDAGCFYQPFQ